MAEQSERDFINLLTEYADARQAIRLALEWFDERYPPEIYDESCGTPDLIRVCRIRDFLRAALKSKGVKGGDPA